MIRRFAALGLSAFMTVAALAPTGAAAADSAPIPSSMAAVGDSITQAASSGGSLGVDAPENSWSTGTSTTVNSHFLRLRALNPQLTAFNRSVSGAKVANLYDQMGTVLALDPDPGYVTVLIGGNDLCTDTVAQMTSVTDFRAQFAAAMQRLMDNSSSTHVYVVSIPDVWQLWDLFKGSFWARFIWASAEICQSLLANPTSTQAADEQRRAEVRQRNIDFNTQLRQVCESHASRCRFDANAVFNTKFSRSDVSGDYFHPSVAGQAKLASVSWTAGYAWSSTPVPNTPPTASFTPTCEGLSCTFDGSTSTDGDGSISSYAWTFGDGSSGTGAVASHTYAAGGTYSVTLTVVDDDAAPASTSQPVSVSAAEPDPNSPPTASFTVDCTGLSCSFTDTSIDGDGTIVSRGWTFGDGTSSSATNPSHDYGGDGTYTVTLTVTDDDAGSDSASTSVEVAAPASPGLSLSVSAYKVKGQQKADLTWSGASTTAVIVYRDGVVVATPANDGAYTDPIDARGGGTYLYRVCETGSSGACSPEVSASF